MSRDRELRRLKESRNKVFNTGPAAMDAARKWSSFGERYSVWLLPDGKFLVSNGDIPKGERPVHLGTIHLGTWETSRLSVKMYALLSGLSLQRVYALMKSGAIVPVKHRLLGTCVDINDYPPDTERKAGRPKKQTV